MNLRTSTLPAIISSVMLVACSTAPAQQTRSQGATSELATALQGRTAGRAVTCIPNVHGRSQMHVIDDRTILFHDGDTIYVQTPRSGCSGIGQFGFTLVTRQNNMQLCEGDLNQLVNISTGASRGACVFGPFVPYKRVN